MLYPYDSSQPTTGLIGEALRQHMVDADGRDLIVHSEYLDLIHFPTDADKERETRQLAEKYAGTKLSIVIPVGTDATRYFLRYRDRLAPGVPGVFCCMEHSALESLGNLPPDVTGLTSRVDIAKGLDLALALDPENPACRGGERCISGR